MPLPTLVIAGAQKCGTSTLHRLLRSHPQVSMSVPKEVHFFDRHWDRGLDWYSARFTPMPEHAHAGESTPIYLYSSTARERMMQTLPDAKVVVALRDPVKRAYSHYWHSKRLDNDEAASFEEALDLEPSRLEARRGLSKARYSYLDRGHYIDQLLALEKTYGPDQLQIILLEDLIADRVTCLERLFGFLDISTEPASTIKEQWKNRYRIGAGESESAKPVAYPPMTPETRKRLVEHYQPYNDRLAEWLGRDLSDWNKV